jgi:2-dehydro-3-deoxygluconokinase
MGRVEPEGMLRLRQALPGRLTMTFAGTEANVAASLAMLGLDSRYVTALPKHAIADALVDRLRGLGIDTRFVLRRDEGRLGLFFVEAGANQRPSVVVYDRDGATVAITPASAYAWDRVFDGATWFHITGVTPSISKTAAEATLAAARAARAAGLRVSCDLNFRNKLWRWDPPTPARELAGRVMREILASADLVVGNEEDAADVLGIRAKDTDVASGRVVADRYVEVAETICKQVPSVKRVAFTLRESHSASWNGWGAMLYDGPSRKACFAPLADGRYEPYQIRNIVDRVGAGDSFAAALIYAELTADLREQQTAVAFAAAASCLCHSIQGDFNYSGRAEIEALMKGSGSGRVVR